MLRPRIIPCLLIHDKGLVKTVQFRAPKYVGDPVNAVKIFNEKGVDEIVILDIDATARNAEPDYGMIRDTAAECRMPLCYGGGVRTVEQAVRIIKLGVEKVALSAAAVADPALVTRVAEHVGSQSVVVVLDVKTDPQSRRPAIWTHNGSRNTHRDPVSFACELEERGVGEITINSIERDGTMQGYDLELIRAVREAVTVPMTVLGGAGNLRDIEAVIRAFGIIGVSAGSLFVFKGAYKAVLINYPSLAERRPLYDAALAMRVS